MGFIFIHMLKNTDMATSEAQHVLRLISGHKLSYPVYFDMEDNSTLESDLAQLHRHFAVQFKTQDMQLVYMQI